MLILLTNTKAFWQKLNNQNISMQVLTCKEPDLSIVKRVTERDLSTPVARAPDHTRFVYI